MSKQLYFDLFLPAIEAVSASEDDTPQQISTKIIGHYGNDMLTALKPLLSTYWEEERKIIPDIEVITSAAADRKDPALMLGRTVTVDKHKYVIVGNTIYQACNKCGGRLFPEYTACVMCGTTLIGKIIKPAKMTEQPDVICEELDEGIVIRNSDIQREKRNIDAG